MPRRDPTGKRALFEAPVSAPPEQLRPGATREGRDAVFSAGPREPGTVMVDCSSCHARTRVSLVDLCRRLLTGSLIVPLRRKGWFLRCPTCGSRAWCSIGFRH
jgi:hypothetical protein